MLASGAALCFDSGSSSSRPTDEDLNGDGENNDIIQNNGANAGHAMTVEVDINGVKGPNVSGRDFFSLDVSGDGLVHDSLWTDSSTIDTSAAGPMPIGKIIEDGWQMTY